jgi:hypothetical protein
MVDTVDMKSSGLVRNSKRCLKLVHAVDLFGHNVPSRKRHKPFRKHVRFGMTNTTEPHTTIIEYRPLCSEYTDEEKMQRWMQPLEQSDIRTLAKLDAQQFVSSPITLPISKAEAFIKGFSYTYHASKEITSAILSDDSDNDSHDSATTVQSVSSSSTSQAVVSMLQSTPDLMLILARSDIRGLEDRIVPIIGIDRRIVRKRIIQAVAARSNIVSVQRKNILNQIYDTQIIDNTVHNALLSQLDSLSANAIRAQYEEFSFSARFFAEAVGLIDATAAMIEYSDSEIAS